MGLRRILLGALALVAGLTLTPLIGLPLPAATLIGLGLAGTTILLLRRRARQKQQLESRLSTVRPMKLRQFISLLQIVALVAILYSPSALSFPIGPIQPTNFQALQPYLTTLQSKHQVTIANDTASLLKALGQPGKKAYFLIGPDPGHNLTTNERNTISSEYLNGTLSLLIAEGNTANNPFLQNLFATTIGSGTIYDNTTTNGLKANSPYAQNFNTTIDLDGHTIPGAIDPSPPILIQPPFLMRTVAASGGESREIATDQNATTNTYIGPRTVIAASETDGDRALLLSDSSPFSKDLYNLTLTDPNTNQIVVNETAFAISLTNWVTRSDTTTKIILDNAHYSPAPLAAASLFNINLPIGRIFAIVLAIIIQLSSSLYNGFLSFTRPYILGVALFTAWSLYGTIVKRYATERPGKDDEPLPRIEKNIIAESRERRDFLTTSRKKGFYVATLDQMHDVLDSLVEKEFGNGIGALKPEQLTNRLGEQQGIEAAKFFQRLTTIARYARGEKRILLPPVLRWKQTTKQLTEQAEKILNQLGLTMTGKAQKKQLDYKLRRC